MRKCCVFFGGLNTLDCDSFEMKCLNTNYILQKHDDLFLLLKNIAVDRDKDKVFAISVPT